MRSAHLNRRRFIGDLSAAAAMASVSASGLLATPWVARAEARLEEGKPLTLTPGQTEGPYYPRRFPADVDNDLLKLRGRSNQPSHSALAMTISGSNSAIRAKNSTTLPAHSPHSIKLSIARLTTRTHTGNAAICSCACIARMMPSSICVQPLRRIESICPT